MKWVQSQQSKDCGAACLATIALHYGLRLDINRIAALAATDRQGARLDSLRDAAHELGFAASCGKLKQGGLCNLPFPAIAHLERAGGDHYVVIFKWSEQNVTIIDPSIGKRRIPLHEWDKEFSGFVLLLKPDEHFRIQASSFLGRSPLHTMLYAIERNLSKFSMALISAILVSCAGLLAPYFLRTLIDSAASPLSATPFLVKFAVELFVLVAIARASFVLLKHFYIDTLSRQIEHDFLFQFIEQLPELPLSLFDRLLPADLVARVNDATQLRSMIAGPILNLTIDISYLGISFIAISLINLPLSAVVATCVIASYALHAYMRPRQLSHVRHTRAAMTLLTDLVLETTIGIKSVKTFVIEEDKVRHMSAKHAEALSSLRKTNLWAGWATTCGALVSGISLAIVIFLAGHLIAAHRLTMGQLLYVIAISSVMMVSSETVANTLNSIEEAALSAERLMRVEDREPGYSTASHEIRAFKGVECLRLVNVSFSYCPDNRLIDNLSFSVIHGQAIGIKGESGSGKSTLAMLLNGLYHPTRGDLHVFGCPVEQWNIPLLRRTVHLISSDSNLLSGSIRDNLKMGLKHIQDCEIMRAAELACAHEFIINLPRSYGYQLGHIGFGLSSGQKQRIALARAFLANPPILVMDEATCNLDIEMEDIILARLLKERSGSTTIIISHRPETLRRVESIWRMQNGELSLMDQIVEQHAIRR